ncbi:alkaline phosphatase PafA [Adhaeribacter terreus]|uniref:Alkaline phosphatase PafA n=1 Tax=Adhaeribacter terreus TaxID=529703 RepID=A0ABW0E8K2_9BACT
MNFRRFPVALLLVFVAQTIPFFASAKPKSKPLDRPKLVVGMVVDQMRYDFLYRYWDQYSEGGFKRLLKDGYSFENTQYNYVPTHTGPGHASIYTGTTPATHGIVGNDWYDCETGLNMYCTQDQSAGTIGSKSVYGQMSPNNLKASTITDELRLATNMRSKVIGVCLKDRGSILPSGHMPSAAYWYDGSIGGWITSTYYAQNLPAWVEAYNAKKPAEKYLSQPWNTLLPLNEYTQSTPDDNEFENPFKGATRPAFPHNLPVLRNGTSDILRNTPFGNTFTREFAMEVIKQEKMGQGNFTDFLALSFSATDYIGHQFGPNSVETQDTYLRLDKDIAEFLTFLDKQFGKKNVLVFLTADHGVNHVQNYLKSLNMPGGSNSPVALKDSLDKHLQKELGPGNWISTYDNQQVYLNRKLIESKKIPLRDVQQKTVAFLQKNSAVAKVVSAEELRITQWHEGLLGMMQRGFHPQRSGDVLVAYHPGWLEGYGGPSTKGTSHGTNGRYDTHVPLIFYGWNVKKGQSSEEVYITDIAPTLAQWLKIQEPSGCIGKALQHKMK